MNKSIISMCLVAYLLTGCGGRDANLVSRMQAQDTSLTCEQIMLEMAQTETKIKQLIPQTNKTAKNTVLGVTGWFLIVPWFFMDFSDAEKQEIQALRDRYDHLNMLATKRDCKF